MSDLASPTSPIDRHEHVSCPRCGFANESVARFCQRCGQRLLIHCWSCGHAGALDARFCWNCGSGLLRPADQVTSTATLAAVPSPVPPEAPAAPPEREVRDADSLEREDRPRPDYPVSENGDVPADEERRVVTILFADIVGFTALSEHLDPEAVREVAATTMGKLVESVALFGGTVDKFMGDAVMAIFGAPIAHADDPARAVRAALAMQHAMVDLCESARGRGLSCVELRIGINTGEVVAGSRDVSGYREYSVYGDAVNTAARLQAAAEPGGILLGESTARLVQGMFELQPTELLQLRGREQPVRAFRVLGPGPAARSSAVREQVPLIGRITELRRLRERVQELARGRGQIVSVVGEHGLGKSRLIAEVRGHASELGVRWVEARAPSFGERLSYRLLQELLAAIAGVDLDDADELVARELRAELTRLGLEEAFGPLANVLGLPLEPDQQRATVELNAEQVQRRLLVAVRQTLRELARERPLMIVLDDLQWADPSSIDALADLVSLSDEAPVLFCLAFAPDRDAPVWGLKELAARALPHRYTEIALGPLSAQAAQELARSLLDCAETPPQVEEMILSRAEGNPFFVEEIIRALIDTEVIERQNGRWLVHGDLGELHIPDTLLATVTARIDRLPEGVRRTLQVASVIGREFSERVLRRVVDGGDELDRHLREAQRAGLIREEAAIPERRYAFTQAVIQEAARHSLLLRRLKELNVQVGWALEELYADEIEEHTGALARHYYEGEEWERAFRYSKLAGRQAARAYANEEAIAYLTMAMEAAAHSAAGADPEVAASLAEERGDVLSLVGQYDRAIEDYEGALRHHRRAAEGAAPGSEEAAREARHVGSLALKIARVHGYRFALPPVEASLRTAFANLSADSPDLAQAWALQALVQIWKQDVTGARESVERALSIARERGAWQHRSAVYQVLTHPALLSILGQQGPRLAEEWVQLAREQQSRSTLLKALVAHAFTHVWGLWTFEQDIEDELGEALQLARAISSPAAENAIHGLRGAGLVLQGRWDEAEQELRRVYRQPTSLIGLDALNAFWLVRLLLLRGELREASQLAEDVLEMAPNPHLRLSQDANLALARLRAGDHEGARAALERASETLASLGCPQCTAFFDAMATEVYAELGDADRALDLAARAREINRQFPRIATELAASRAEGMVKLRSGDAAGAIATLRAAWARAEELGQPYERARTGRLLGEAYLAADDVEKGRRYLSQALEVFERLGARPEADQVMAALRTTPQPV